MASIEKRIASLEKVTLFEGKAALTTTLMAKILSMKSLGILAVRYRATLLILKS
jgi:hypothetical protein